MYVRVGHISNASQLASVAQPLFSEMPKCGYFTSSAEIIKETFYPYLKHILPYEWSKCMLAVLWPDRTIPPHLDVWYESRFNFTLQVGDNSWIKHELGWFQPELGSVYKVNPRKIHSTVCWDKDPKISLVVDIHGDVEVVNNGGSS